MFKLFSMLVVGGAAALAGFDSAQTCGGCCSAPAAQPPKLRARRRRLRTDGRALGVTPWRRAQRILARRP